MTPPKSANVADATLASPRHAGMQATEDDVQATAWVRSALEEAGVVPVDMTAMAPDFESPPNVIYVRSGAFETIMIAVAQRSFMDVRREMLEGVAGRTTDPHPPGDDEAR